MNTPNRIIIALMLAAAAVNVSAKTTKQHHHQQSKKEMKMEQNQKKTTRTAFLVIGSILSLIAIVKFSIIGYYPREALPFGIMLIAGLICLIIAQKIKIVKLFTVKNIIFTKNAKKYKKI